MNSFEVVYDGVFSISTLTPPLEKELRAVKNEGMTGEKEGWQGGARKGGRECGRVRERIAAGGCAAVRENGAQGRRERKGRKREY